VRILRGRGLPIFWQTLLLLLASVVVVFVVTIGLFLSSPPPRPDFNSLSDIAEALAGRKVDRVRQWQLYRVPRDGGKPIPVPRERRGDEESSHH